MPLIQNVRCSKKKDKQEREREREKIYFNYTTDEKRKHNKHAQ